MRTLVRNVRTPVLCCLFALFSHITGAQSFTTTNGKFEVGIGVGPMFFLGDLGGSEGHGKRFVKDLDFPMTKLSKGIYLNYYPTDFIGLRIAANLGQLESDDAAAPDKPGRHMDRRERNLHFRTPLKEAYAAIEIYPTVFMEGYGGLQGKIRPYILGGVGIFNFNPEAKDVNGQWVKLHPLRLEGQGFAEYPESKPYELTQMNLLMGGGVKYYLKEHMYIGFEILHRQLFTDYVDDVSQDFYVDPIHFDTYLSPADAAVARRLYYRATYSFPTTRPYEEFAERGDPSENDAYFSGIIRIGWRLGQNNGPLRQLKCPVFY